MIYIIVCCLLIPVAVSIAALAAWACTCGAPAPEPSPRPRGNPMTTYDCCECCEDDCEGNHIEACPSGCPEGTVPRQEEPRA